MIMDSTALIFESSPHVHTRRTTAGAMRHVLIALLPSVLCSIYYFGLPALLVLIVSVFSCMVVEWLITKYMLRRDTTLADGSALLTGVLLALNLPANLPLWMPVAGAVMAIGVAKMAFGGLGCNIFNPALVGRVFLLISFPVAMTSWPLAEPGVFIPDGITGATPLALLKNGAEMSSTSLLLGNIGGSMGEVSAVALLLGFVYLLIVRVIKWHIPVAIVLGVALIDLIAGYPLLTDILTGGLLLGAIFMATDYVTSPMSRKASWVYGLLIGIITASIRRWGAYPEGMSFAILLMNGATPLLNRYLRPTRFSARKRTKA